MAEKNTDKTTQGISYRDAGVDIDNASRLVDKIKHHARATSRPGVMSGLGGFGALFELPLDKYRHPVLVSGTDGVGTKLKLAIETGKHDTIGIDLVAMCVNDLIVQGAEPLFFLDYYATGKLDVDVADSVIKGIANGCKQANAALIGGETAEMPGMYNADEYDLAGFCVGIVEKAKIIDGSRVSAGDSLIGIASSGPHSNGYSLIRKIIDVKGIDLASGFNGRSLGETLLEPTRIYVRPVLELIEQIPVHAIAHITGGGILENLPRVMPDGLCAKIDATSWTMPDIFQWLQQQGNVDSREMYRTLNCGVGMVIIVPEQASAQALECLNQAGETAWQIGMVRIRGDDDPQVLIS